MKNLSASQKLYMVMTILVVVGIAILVISIEKMSEMKGQIHFLVDVSTEKERLGAGMNQELLMLSRAEKGVLLAESEADMATLAAEAGEIRTRLEEKKVALDTLLDSEGRKVLTSFSEKWMAYLKVHERVLELARLNSNVRAAHLSSGKGQAAYERCAGILADISQTNNALARKKARIEERFRVQGRMVSQLIQSLLNIHRAEKNVILEDEQTSINKYKKVHKNYITSTDYIADRLKTLTSGESRTLFNAFENAYKEFLKISHDVVDFAGMGIVVEARTFSAGEGRDAYNRAEAALDRLAAWNDERSKEAREAADRSTQLAFLSERVIQDLLAIHREEKMLVDETTQQGMAAQEALIAGTRKTLEEKLDKMKTLATQESLALIQQFEEQWQTFKVIGDAVGKLIRENGNARARRLSAGEGQTLLNGCESLIHELLAMNGRDMEQDRLATDRKYTLALRTLLVVSIAGIVLAAVLGIVILRSIGKRLNRTAFLLDDGADQVTVASRQVARAGQDLAQRASRQAASLEETSASLEEIASMTRQNSDNAHQADTLMKNANQVVTVADQSMGELIRSMADMTKAGQETATIVKTIDEIAFQTNLLALNATFSGIRRCIGMRMKWCSVMRWRR